MKFSIALVAVVSAVAEAIDFKSGAVTGFEKFTYGKFVTRMKAPNKKGTVSSFFTYWNGPNFFPGGWNELDIEIVPSVNQNPFSMNAIYGDGEVKRESHDYRNQFDPKEEWHIYEMAWTPDFIAWSIDNKEVRRIKKDDPAVKFTNKPMSVMMNFWTPTFESWGKGLDAKDMPWFLEFDYVETYTYNHETKGFDFNWRDNFNTFDTNRWHKSDNMTFDANSTTFRASQAFIKEGSLVLKMEPDHPEDVHGVHRHELPEVRPVMTEPTPEHTVTKGQKVKKGDEHYDVAAEQHYSHLKREAEHEVPMHPMGGYPYGAYPVVPGNPYGHAGYYGEYARHADPYAQDEYARGLHYPAREGHSFMREDPYVRREPFVHQDPYMHHEQEVTAHNLHYQQAPQGHEHVKELSDHDPYHYDPYHHPEPPKSKAEAEKHLGPEAAYFYQEMHKMQQQQQQQQQKQQSPQKQAPIQQQQRQPMVQQPKQKNEANFATDYHIDHEETPYEHKHPEEEYHTRELVEGFEHHPEAHFEQGYWDLKDHMPHLGDEGHFRGEDHGEYHYLEPERTHHLGHYYNWNDEREHYPQHVDQHHDAHGIEHRPDDWVQEHETHYVHHDEYQHVPEHSYGGDFELVSGRRHAQDYGHDVDYHGGSELMHDIEHEFDDLFHNIEDHTIHGVEHHDIHYTTLHKTDLEEGHHEETDFHAQPHAKVHEHEMEHAFDYAHEHHGRDGHYFDEEMTRHQREGHRAYGHEERREHHHEERREEKGDHREPEKEQKKTEQKKEAGKKLDFSDQDVKNFVQQVLSTSSFNQ